MICSAFGYDKKSAPTWVTFIAGGTGGALSAAANNPIDVVKSRMQGLDAAKYSSTMDCARQLYAEGGIGALYKGVGPRITRVMFEVAITMSLYGEVVKFLDRFDGTIF